MSIGYRTFRKDGKYPARARERRARLGHGFESIRGPRFSVTFPVTYELMERQGVNRERQKIVRRRAKHRHHCCDGL